MYAWGSSKHGKLGLGTRVALGRGSAKESLPLPKFVLGFVLFVIHFLFHSLCSMQNVCVVSSCVGVSLFIAYTNAETHICLLLCFKRPRPVTMPGRANVSSIAAGETHSAAITTTGRVFVWGGNRHGQLGKSPEEGPFYSPKFNNALSKYKLSKISFPFTHGLGLARNGKLYSWGACSAEDPTSGGDILGREFTSDGIGWVPAKVSDPPEEMEMHYGGGGVKWQAASAGKFHSVAASEGGRLFVWGRADTPSRATVLGYKDGPKPATCMPRQIVSFRFYLFGQGGDKEKHKE